MRGCGSLFTLLESLRELYFLRRKSLALMEH